MRTNFVKNQLGEIKYEWADDWPYLVVGFSPNERVIYTADGKHLILQYRHRHEKSGQWRRWVRAVKTASSEEMRKLMERFHPFSSDIEKLEVICLKTEDGDYVEHSH
ncbi:hypothetical protein [Rhizobium rhizoryzae]|jgi:hypothetical protein|uniref:hypothetical protein n=1 Tax=Rhizobium rhizoryzae TaxID=451876 RepID=UPI00289D5CD7|nr:hypothetical protein [Rhizobium rhizoryzae]